MVDARDLVSIGTPAGVHLRELVDRFAHSRTRCIVVLLHADDILAARGSGGDHDGSNHGSGKSSKSRSSVVHDHSAAEGCLYSLLELLKVNRPCCGLVRILFYSSLSFLVCDVSVSLCLSFIPLLLSACILWHDMMSNHHPPPPIYHLSTQYSHYLLLYR